MIAPKYSYKLKYLCILLLVINSSSAEDFTCKEDLTDVTADEGTLVIPKNLESCGFKGKSKNQLFVIQTDNLALGPNDTITVSPDDTKKSQVTFKGPQEDGYIVSAGLNEIVFKIAEKDNTTMMVKFYQNLPIPVIADRNKILVFQNNFVEQSYQVHVSKRTDSTVYVQTESSRLLLDSPQGQIDMPTGKRSELTLSKVVKSCSGSHASKAEETIEVNGPTSDELKNMDSYKCVHIFKNELGGKAHFDVSFKNFLDLTDSADHLTVTDGTQTLDVFRSNSKQYKGLLPYVSFTGPDLVVVYDSPGRIAPLNIPFKLSVNARSIGGVVNSFDYKFDLPSKDSAFYSLIQPAGKQGNVALEFDKLTGIDMNIYNRQNQVISLKNPNYPSSIIFDMSNGDHIGIEFLSTKVKASGSVKYTAGENCGGTLFESSGTISIKGSNKTCYWLLGGQSNLLSVNLNEGYFELYSMKSPAPLLTTKNLRPTDSLPPINVDGPAYMKINLGLTENSFQASVTPKLPGQVSSQDNSQRVTTSTGYPNFYSWAAVSESLTVDAKNKAVVLSVADLDLRDGEQMSVDKTNIERAPFDIDLKNQTTEIKIQRTGSTDLKVHRGYKIVTTEFQVISVANMSTNTITTPENLTSFLLRILGAAGNRINYNIATSSKDNNYVMQVKDSDSILGRPAQATEQTNGSSTSNVVVISLRTSKDKVFLPTFMISYSQVACNKTTDHVCDHSARCVPAVKMCKGVSYCDDGSDLKVPCSSGPVPAPKVIESGVSGVAFFLTSMLMFTIGILAALYGPDLFKSFEARYRSGQYTTFQSTE